MFGLNKITNLFDDNIPSLIYSAVGCNIGSHRAKNEDNFNFDGKTLNSDNNGLENVITEEFYIPNDEIGSWKFFGIFDGMGGGSYGELASSSAAQSISDFLSKKDNINPYDITVSLDEMFQTTNMSVFQTANRLGASHMGSTMVSLFYYAERVWVSNIGDSPGYLFRDGNLIKITEDHIEQGVSGRKPFLTQYLGMNPGEIRIKPTITCFGLEKNDRFLLCSDGLTDMVSADNIQKILLQVDDNDQCVDYLINEALKNGGIDNITVMLFSIQ